MNFIQHRSVLCAPALEGVKDELAVLSNVPPGLPGSYWLARPTEGQRYIPTSRSALPIDHRSALQRITFGLVSQQADHPPLPGAKSASRRTRQSSGGHHPELAPQGNKTNARHNRSPMSQSRDKDRSIGAVRSIPSPTDTLCAAPLPSTRPLPPEQRLAGSQCASAIFPLEGDVSNVRLCPLAQRHCQHTGSSRPAGSTLPICPPAHSAFGEGKAPGHNSLGWKG